MCERMKGRGCRARFTVNQRNGLLVVACERAVMVHNHRCCEMEYRLDPAVRRLSSEERREVMRLVGYGMPTNRIRLMARLEYKKYLTRWDIHNLKCHLIETAVPASQVLCVYVFHFIGL